MAKKVIDRDEKEADSQKEVVMKEEINSFPRHAVLL